MSEAHRNGGKITTEKSTTPAGSRPLSPQSSVLPLVLSPFPFVVEPPRATRRIFSWVLL